MKASILTAMMATALFLAINTPAWAHDPLLQVLRNQIKRIEGGIQNGQITQKEQVRLQREQNRIQTVRRQAMSDGRLRPAERRRLTKMQQKASEHIYRAKHNNRVRYNRCENRYDHRRPRPEGTRFSGTWVFPGWALSIANGGKW